MEAGEVSCCVSVEALDSNGVVSRRKTYKSVRLLLGRDEFQDIILKIESQRSPLGKNYRLRDITIHKRFLKDGKATIKLVTQKMQLLLSNCPPSQLAAFLKCISLKLAKQKTGGFTSERRRLLSEKPRSFEYISPLTHKDLPEGQDQSCRKRQRDDAGHQTSTTPKRIKTTNNNLESGPLRKRLNGLGSFQVELTKEQLAVVKAVRAKRNVFFTGSAGTGKSHLLKSLIGILPPQSTFVTASTGVAASHICGTTLHAFAGIGTGSAPLVQCVELASRPGIMQKWKRCQHLIIDEISMVDGDFFDKLEAVARSIKKNDRPFGGIHLILSGDFLQLPPVAKYTEKKKFAFQAASWRDCISNTTELVQVHRQKDPVFISILQNIRVGSCPTKLVDRLMATKNQQIEKDSIQATKLCTHKENVNQINIMHLEQLPGKVRMFNACDSDSSLSQTLDKQLPVEEKLDLKVGAQVMLTKNLDVSKGLVNGARGIILDFEPGNSGYPIVKFKSGVKKVMGPEKWVVKMGAGGTVTRKQLPLRLAWAVSIHKSQGMTLDCVEISLSRVFEYGQAYVALSRARSLQGLRVLDFDSKSVCAHPDVLRFYAKLRRESKMTVTTLHKLGDEDKENRCLY